MCAYFVLFFYYYLATVTQNFPIWSLWPVELILWRKYCIFNPCLPPANYFCLQPSTRCLMPRVYGAMPGCLLLICDIRSTVDPGDPVIQPGLGQIRTKEVHTAAGNPMHCIIISKIQLFKTCMVYKYINTVSLYEMKKDIIGLPHSTASGVPMKLREIQCLDKQHF